MLGTGFATQAASELGWRRRSGGLGIGRGPGDRGACLDGRHGFDTRDAFHDALGRLKIIADRGDVGSRRGCVDQRGQRDRGEAHIRAGVRSIQAGQAPGKLDAPRQRTVSAGIGPWIKGVVVDPNGAARGRARVRSLWTIRAQDVTTKADGTFVIPNNETRLLNLAFFATANEAHPRGYSVSTT